MGVNIETIRFYQRRGLLSTPPKPRNGFRHYTQSDLARLRFIKSAQSLGFTLDEVAELLTLEDGTHCEEAAQLAQIKLADVRSKLANLHRIDAALAELIASCHSKTGTVACSLINSLHKS